MRLSRESALELRNFLASVTAVLARYADSDLEAKRLYRKLSAAESGGTSSTRMVYLSADDANGVRSDMDVGGHYITRYDGGPDNCLRCTAALLAAGDVSAEMPAGAFPPSERHRKAQTYIVRHAGVRYLEALQKTEEESA